MFVKFFPLNENALGAVSEGTETETYTGAQLRSTPVPDTCLKIENKNMEFQTSSVVYREYLQNKKFNLLCRTELMSTSDLHSVQLLSFEGIVK